MKLLYSLVNSGRLLKVFFTEEFSASGIVSANSFSIICQLPEAISELKGLNGFHIVIHVLLCNFLQNDNLPSLRESR